VSSEITFPTESWGLCRIKRCNFEGQLGDGLCELHYDRQVNRVGPRRPMDQSAKDRLRAKQQELKNAG